MSVETDLYDTLANDAGVSALVSTRIYPSLAPESAARPYIIYSVVSVDRYHTLPGVNDPANKRLQMECVDDGYSGAKAVAVAAIAALQGNGYQQSEYDLYDDQTQAHSIFVDWSFVTD